ncbi:MAG TPA: exonuclease [Firmicutes bacterium]|jgi:DNA polymerase III subunit epsilon|nr:exonuclease [Bacillota bacterium]
MLDFTAIDFETATNVRWSVCQVGLVRVENANIVDTYSSLIQPPDNRYVRWNTAIHGISSMITRESPTFPEIWEKIKGFIENQLVVAHNVNFDADCLKQTLRYYNLEIPDFTVDCTYQKTGASLDKACQALEINLDNHHDALEDAVACANIYLCLAGGRIPDYSKIKPAIKTAKPGFNFNGHERIKGELLKPNLEDAKPDSAFYGKKVVFTGILFSIGREEAARIVRSLGADIDSGVTPKTNYVIVGSDPGPSKMRKIVKYNQEGSLISIIREAEFLKMIEKLA